MPGASRIRRSGDVVRRPLGFWSPAVHQLLGYLQDAGFPAALAHRGIEPQATWVHDGYLGTVRARIRWTEALRL